MQTSHNITILQNSIIIDEMFFRLEEIRFVDVTEQELPILRQFYGVGGWVNLFIALLFLCFEIGPAAAFFFFCAFVQLILRYTYKRRYALRIGQQLGTTKAIISTDRTEMEAVKSRILQALAEKTDNKPKPCSIIR